MDRRWLIRTPKHDDDGIQLFCFPYAGGGAAMFMRWSAFMQGVDVCGVQLPGRESRLSETPFASIHELLPEATHCIARSIEKPYALFGHSMGALIAFCVANALRSYAVPQPQMLIVSGRRAPHLPRHGTAAYDATESNLVQKLRNLGGTPEQILSSREMMGLMLPTLKADFSVCETYIHQPHPPLPCPIEALGGLDDEHVKQEQLSGWQEHTSGRFGLRMFPGGHFFIHTQASEVAAYVCRLLRGAMPPN